jgi:hypothetical protein
MPTKIIVIHAHDFIKASPEGQLDVETSEKLLLEIVSASAPLVDCAIILDTRHAQSEMAVGDLWHLAAELGNHPDAFSGRTAVLCPQARFDHAAFFALCAQNRGFRVMAFTSYEEAIEWLAVEEA